VVSGVVEERWSGFPLRYRETRARVLRFCLAALQVEPPRVAGTQGLVTSWSEDADHQARS
jgi:hypothetical protein